MAASGFGAEKRQDEHGHKASKHSKAPRMRKESLPMAKTGTF